jgi:hypothetical protein
MKTTLNRIKEFHPRMKEWSRLLKHLEKSGSDNEQLSLLTIYESNGIDFAVWCMRAVDCYDNGKRLMAMAFTQEAMKAIKGMHNPGDYARVMNLVESYDIEEDADYMDLDSEDEIEDDVNVDYAAYHCLYFIDDEVLQKQIDVFKKIVKHVL